MPQYHSPLVVLLDIEGTTTRFAFVHEVLFPFARTHLTSFLQSDWDTEPLRLIRTRLADEWHRDADRGTPEISTITGVDAYLRRLMEQDRKSTALKQLQGLIWQRGYESGVLCAEVFDDVPRAMQRWHRGGTRIAIYSSGSVLAQRLLFSSTPAGDLTPLISAFFDTETGPKMAATSYRAIAAALDCATGDITFISDAPAELLAAHEAGMSVVMSVRPGNPVQDAPTGVTVIRSFDDLEFAAR